MVYFLAIIPVIFLIGSVLLAIRAVKKGTKTKKAIMIQMLSFFCVCLICIATPFVASAASDDEDVNAATTASEEVAADSALSTGLGLIAAALVTAVSGIGGGLAVAAAAPAAIAATSEDPQAFGKSLIFVALGEGIALYGLLVSILILAKI